MGKVARKIAKQAELLAIADRLPKTNYGERKIEQHGKYIVEYLPEGYQALNKELATGLHPKLEKILQAQDADEIDIKLANICTYCLVAVDGIYDLAQRDQLCFTLAGRLEAMRELPSPQEIIQ